MCVFCKQVQATHRSELVLKRNSIISRVGVTTWRRDAPSRRQRRAPRYTKRTQFRFNPQRSNPTFTFPYYNIISMDYFIFKLTSIQKFASIFNLSLQFQLSNFNQFAIVIMNRTCVVIVYFSFINRKSPVMSFTR